MSMKQEQNVESKTCNAIDEARVDEGRGKASGRTEETRFGLSMDFSNIAEGWSFLVNYARFRLRLFRVLIRAQLFQLGKVWQILSFLTLLTANISSKKDPFCSLVKVKIVTAGSWSHLHGNSDARWRRSISRFRMCSGVSSARHNVPLSCWKASPGEPIRSAVHGLGPRVLYRDEQATFAWNIPAAPCLSNSRRGSRRLLELAAFSKKRGASCTMSVPDMIPPSSKLASTARPLPETLFPLAASSSQPASPLTIHLAGRSPPQGEVIPFITPWMT
jgi:hypothetical protein